MSTTTYSNRLDNAERAGVVVLAAVALMHLHRPT